MKAVFLRAGAVLLAASLAGCAATDGPRLGSEVTRFHLGDQIARAQIAIEPADPRAGGTAEFQTYAGVVAAELTRLGWTVVNGVANSEQVAIVNVGQGNRESHSNPVMIGIGAGGGGYNGGVGGGASFPVGGGVRPITGTMLEVRIKRRSDGTVFWEGRATTEAAAGSPDTQPIVAVQKLAAAMFGDFPGESGRTIRLK